MTGIPRSELLRQMKGPQSNSSIDVLALCPVQTNLTLLPTLKVGSELAMLMLRLVLSEVEVEVCDG